jgi:hypothetical protein
VSEPTPQIDNLPRGYTKLGSVAHILPAWYSLEDNNDSALCGVWPKHWYGHNTDEERARLATLPTCARCLRLLEHDIELAEAVAEHEAAR